MVIDWCLCYLMGEVGSVDRPSYRALLRTPSVSRLLASSIVARLPISMTAIAVVLAVTQAGGSYAKAGLVSAAIIFAEGLTQPFYGRAADRLRPRRVLRFLATANCVVSLPLAGLVPRPLSLLLVIAALTRAP